MNDGRGNSLAATGAGLLSGGFTIFADASQGIEASNLKAAATTLLAALMVWAAQEITRRISRRAKSRQATRRRSQPAQQRQRARARIARHKADAQASQDSTPSV